MRTTRARWSEIEVPSRVFPAAYRREEFPNDADERASWESIRMSFDLAVWEGDRPATDADASAIYERLMNRMEAADFMDPPSPRIRAYVESLLERWPDITEDDGEDSPWADGPLIGNAFGDAIYFGMVWSRAEAASDFAARLAAQHGLVCYDPQSESLRPRGYPDSFRPEPPLPCVGAQLPSPQKERNHD